MKSRWLGLLLGSLFSSSLFAANVYVGAVQGISVGDADVATVGELVRTSLASDLNHQLVNTAGEADYTITGRLVKLGEAYSLTLIKSRNSKEVFRATLKASMMSDMDVVVVRLVRSVDGEVSAEKSMTVKDVTLHEERDERRRRQVLSQVSFGLGPASTSNLNVDGGTILWNLGYNYELDFNWDMHVDIDWLSTTERSESDAYFGALNFGMNYYLSEQNYAPYVEGHIGYGGAIASQGCNTNALLCSSHDRATGWLLGAGLGFRFFRASETNFAIVARGSYMMTPTSLSHENVAVGALMLVGFFH